MSSAESSEDERPSFGGGVGLGANRRKFVSSNFEDREGSPAKKMRFSKQNNATKKGETPGYAKAGSFAARMMAQMGYKEGEGLGKEGKGRLAPIETQLRPQGAGLGAVKEKTKQAKEEEKREAAFRGEKIEDSSEEERTQRKQQRIKRPGARTESSYQKPKVKYRTAHEIAQESKGLDVPDTLKTLIDVTGNKTELVTATTTSVDISEEAKIARRAKRDLEAYAEDWRALQERKRYYGDELQRHTQEIDNINQRLNNLQKLLGEMVELASPKTQSSDLETITEMMQLLEVRLHFTEEGQFEETLKSASIDVQEITVAAIMPSFSNVMAQWDPLQTENPSKVIECLTELKEYLGLQENLALVDADGVPIIRNRKHGSYYDTMINTCWLPVVRNTIINHWSVESPEPITKIIEMWKDFLPTFVYSILMNQLIIPRLVEAVKKWKPGNKKEGEQGVTRAKPHEFLFPWLALLPEQHLNPQATNSLFADLRRKFAQELGKLDVQLSPPDWITAWSKVRAFKSTLSTLLTNHLVPRVAQYVNEINYEPTFERRRQVDLLRDTPLKSMSEWQHVLGETTTSHLLSAHFFPRLMKATYEWLITQPDVHEIGNYTKFWYRIMDDEMRSLPAVHSQWTKYFDMIKEAFNLGERVAQDLKPPKDEYSEFKRQQNGSVDALSDLDDPAFQDEAIEQTFKDIVESWCEEYDLILVPLHSAHTATGQPLYRVTASASGRGGVQVYLKGDVVWAQNPKDRTEFVPVELGTQLAAWGGAVLTM